MADFLAGSTPLLQKHQIHAAVRSDEQAKAVSKLGIDVLQLDLKDEAAVFEAISSRKSMGLAFPTPAAAGLS